METKNTDLVEKIKQIYPRVVEWRRHLHQYPELSFQEKQTSAWIAKKLHSLGVFEVEENVGGFGIVATLRGKPGPVIGLRADLDALPIQEQTEGPYTSKHPGVMHACGHDAHAAILLGVAHVLAELYKEGTINGTVCLIFQPAEEDCDAEGKTGAVHMIESGKLDELDAVLALHMCPWLPAGHVQIHDGPSMANNDNFHIVVHGKGGHAGYPHQGRDPIWISTQLLQALYSLNGRTIDPLDVATISIGHLEAGESNNIIPNRVDIKGTIRTYRKSIREQLIHEVHQLASLGKALGGSCDIDIVRGEPALYNHSDINRVIKQVSSHLQIINQPFGMGSEDFGHFTERFPGAMFFLGCKTDPETSLHQDRFDIDEKAMLYGMRILLESTQEFMKKEW
ncbi:amidohydrolase [Halobacillus fulvus]|nr:amidohydrolase [Halobacillus fulvus]